MGGMDADDLGVVEVAGNVQPMQVADVQDMERRIACPSTCSDPSGAGRNSYKTHADCYSHATIVVNLRFN